MLPWIVRQGILPLHEALLGRATFSIWRRLEAQPCPDAETLAEAARQSHWVIENGVFDPI